MPEPLSGIKAGTTAIVNKACDTDAALDLVVETGRMAVLPSEATGELNREACVWRNIVEFLFCQIREFRHKVARREKRARNFLSTVM